MTPNIASKNTRSQFDIKSAATPIQLNRAALAKLQKLDEFDFVFPNGSRHTVVFDRIDEHGDGIHSSVGYLRDHGKDFRVIITSGPDGSFGSIRTPETMYRILPGTNGQNLMIDMAEEQKLIPCIDRSTDVIVTISLNNVSGPTGAATMQPVTMGFLVGDFNSSRTVNAADISAVKSHSGAAILQSNFKFDVNASGGINSTDVSAVKARAGLVLP
jgi:hypothetical protein